MSEMESAAWTLNDGLSTLSRYYRIQGLAPYRIPVALPAGVHDHRLTTEKCEIRIREIRGVRPPSDQPGSRAPSAGMASPPAGILESPTSVRLLSGVPWPYSRANILDAQDLVELTKSYLQATTYGIVIAVVLRRL
ncbi:uncharacterized protein RCC_10985 [Ramularia collo-cygni]|uniref:Uncharacterized protein n=1 Tax=Ramularia collo-cygni TaxID=112498 RepID=A0A2D3V755_9PEZI|nr:uncharacterized protein RCC_10985 [Ramularia collo-cygni]CZT25256.1 uncharacterized protein RCC_10985 [Ramularia collo-cygni]